MHQTAGERELFSDHWLWERPAIKEFFTISEHEEMKSALHCQSDNEIEGQFDQDGRPMLRKIGIVYENMREKCRNLYSPGVDIAYDEISILMSGR